MAPRVADGLTGQATSGLSSAIEAPARHREPPLCHISFLRFLRSPQQSQRAVVVVTGSAALAPAHRCTIATTVPTKAPPCPPIPRRPPSRAIHAVGEGHWPFFRRRLCGRVSPERSSPRPPTTETSLSSSLCLESSVVTSWSSYRARMRQQGLAVIGASRRSSAMPPSPATSPLR